LSSGKMGGNRIFATHSTLGPLRRTLGKWLLSENVQKRSLLGGGAGVEKVHSKRRVTAITDAGF
jgi:hypothetical protein